MADYSIRHRLVRSDNPERAEAKRLEALRYFEEVLVVNDGTGWHLTDPEDAPHHEFDTRSYRGAFERYQRLGVAVYGEGG